MSDLTLPQKLEVLLFREGAPVTKKRLCEYLGCTDVELDAATVDLRHSREASGISVVETEKDIALLIAPVAAPIVSAAFSKEMGKEVGSAGLEVLAIILYRGPSTRAQIDYIRGVNTSSTIRNLTARGLIERVPNPKDSREYLYKPTIELLAHLGVQDAQELPEYAKIASELAAFESQQHSEPGPFDNHAGGGN